jgi:hypothetical protein
LNSALLVVSRSLRLSHRLDGKFSRPGNRRKKSLIFSEAGVVVVARTAAWHRNLEAEIGVQLIPEISPDLLGFDPEIHLEYRWGVCHILSVLRIAWVWGGSQPLEYEGLWQASVGEAGRAPQAVFPFMLPSGP